mmetsp:Transcript_9572/g.10627  ORF Transcript_9572/g.10627 Transcript_9572/m.10627 type:complete len:199 (+) Transcript_9572:49-645(+)
MINRYTRAVGRKIVLFEWLRPSTLRSLTSNSQEDYFLRLNVPRSFDIQPDDLKSSYRQLMAKLHPDRHTLKPTKEQDEVGQKAAKVTHAYQVLRQPHQRAMHLLELINSPLEEEDSGGLVGFDFLEEVMELREEICNAEENEDEVQLKEISKSNQACVDILYAELATAFKTENTKTALKLTAKLQYRNRINETIRDIL